MVGAWTLYCIGIIFVMFEYIYMKKSSFLFFVLLFLFASCFCSIHIFCYGFRILLYGESACLCAQKSSMHAIFSLVPFIVSMNIWTYSIKTYYVVLYGAASHHLQAKHTKLWLCLNRTPALALM